MMRDGRRVSVVVNNHNYARYLRAAVDSALAQTYRMVEVVVVDDGSTDDSRSIIDGYCDRVTPVFRPNGGQAAAFNTGLRACRGDVIFYLDADDFLLPTAVATALPHFDYPEVVNVHWPLWIVDEAGRRTGAQVPDRPLADGDLRAALIRDGPDNYQGAPTSGNAWSRDLLNKVLPAPEPEYRAGADGFLITVAPLHGTLRTVAEPQACYRVHGCNQFWCAAAAERAARSLERYERRSRTLSDHLRAQGVNCDPDAWRHRNPYYCWLHGLHRAAEDLRAVIPAGETFLLADAGEWGTFFADRRSIPFPERDGQYWGAPVDDAAAVAELGRQRLSSNPAFLVIAWPAFWWLDYYAEFNRHLKSHFARILANDRVVVYDLRRRPARSELES
jgi:glycosyltransferase involved in cell wall biosynthesis